MSIPVVNFVRGRTHLHRYLEKQSLPKIVRDVRKLKNEDWEKIFSSSYDPDVPVKVYRTAIYLWAKRRLSPKTILRYYRGLISRSHFSTSQIEMWLDSPNASPRVPDFYKRKYGIHWKAYYDIARKKSNPYNLESVMKRYGLSRREAEIEVGRRKKNTSGSFASFLRRAGGDVSEARRRFRSFCEKSSHTEEKFRKRYGKNYKAKWEEYKKSKNSYDLDKYVAKYGESLGREKLLDRIDRSVVDYAKFVEMYGEHNAEREYIKYCYRKTKSWKRKSGRWGATKESLEFFKPLLLKLDRRNVEYRIGVEGNREFMLLDKESGKVRYYDFCIPSIRVVVEFDGFTHPSPSLSAKKLAKWRCHFTGVSAETRLADDEAKRRVAVSRGYLFFRFHADEIKKDRRRYQAMLWSVINPLLKEKRK